MSVQFKLTVLWNRTIFSSWFCSLPHTRTCMHCLDFVKASPPVHLALVLGSRARFSLSLTSCGSLHDQCLQLRFPFGQLQHLNVNRIVELCRGRGRVTFASRSYRHKNSLTNSKGGRIMVVLPCGADNCESGISFFFCHPPPPSLW